MGGLVDPQRRDVVLVGFQDQGNLGIGYLAATLQRHGHSVEVLEFREGAAAIVERVRAADPLVVGFSLIFQYYLPSYRRMARALREAGVRSHLTMGGHYPSLCHEQVLRSVEELDSIVRFEGELTLLELVERLATGEDWRDVPGLAYRHRGSVARSAPRALIADLDDLPHPLRARDPEHVCGFRALPVLASRGCARRCSFCSIHSFYRGAPGKVIRTRSPARIVEEMRLLHERLGVAVFLFQDDDFPLWGRFGRRWVNDFVRELHEQGLAGRVIWKISCRAEQVEAGLFEALRDAGLYLVYLGLESGTEGGLDVLHKQTTVEQNLAAIETLKRLDIRFQYGFMLLEPSSSFESVRENVGFLRSIVGDGSAAATFCRMLPYGGTPIRAQLREEGRLRGDVANPDYDFVDSRLNEYHRRLNEAAAPWIRNQGISEQLGWAWGEVEILARLGVPLSGDRDYRRSLASLTRRSNETLLDLVEESSLAFEKGEWPGLSAAQSEPACGGIAAELLRLRNAFVAGNETEILAAVPN